MGPPRQTDECSTSIHCHPDGLRSLQAGGPMQSRSARAVQAEVHRSSGAKERRHQDDKAFPQVHVHPSQTSVAWLQTHPRQTDEFSTSIPCHPDGLRFLQAGGPMQSRSARALQASCMGPPAPKNGAIRMTRLFHKSMFIRHRLQCCLAFRLNILCVSLRLTSSTSCRTARKLYTPG